MKRPESPCRDCEFRKELCHADCEVYQTFKKDLESWKAYVKEQQRDDNEQDAIEKDRVKRAMAYIRRSTGKK